MSTWRVAAGLLLGVAAVGSCSSGGDGSTDLSIEGAPASADHFAGPGIDFALARVLVDGVEQSVVNTGRVLHVSVTSVALFTNRCDDQFAGYTLDLEGDLILSDLSGPRRGCGGADAAQADALLEAVSTGARWTLVGDDLVASKGTVEVTFSPLGNR